jgi:endonuclease/exonuclease/phosphatase family metal-dependent hydrolase
MKRWLPALLMIGLIWSAHAETLHIRALQYNIKHTNAGATAIGNIIAASGADIAGLQETTSGNAAAIASRLTTVTGEQWYSQAMLGTNDIDAIVSRYPIIGTTHITMFSDGDFYGAIRTVLQVTVEVPDSAGSPHRMQFFVTHLSTREGTNPPRSRQCQELVDFCKTFPGPRVIVGDFNLDDSRGGVDLTDYQKFTSSSNGNYTDAFRQINPTAAGKTIPVPSPTKRFDYLFYARATGFNAVASDRVINASTDSASDHYPVFADFDWDGNTFNNPPPGEPLGSGSILREYWNNITGGTIASLTGNAAYPNSPTGSQQLTWYLQSQPNSGDNYGQRVRGLITAPANGSFTFWVSGDSEVELWLSSDESPANKSRIAWITGATTLSCEWSAYETPSATIQQQSNAISLVSGRRYYIEVLHKEGTNNDNMAVGWKLPNGNYERPIPARRLSPPATIPSAPVITSSATASASVGASFSYQITASNSPTSFGVTNLPAGLSVNSSSGVISGTPSVAGTTAINLSATNVGGTGTKTLTLSVNGPPSIGSGANASPNPAQTGDTVLLSVTATDPNGDTLSYSWNFGDGSPAGSGPSITHVYGVAGAYLAQVVVTDGKGGSASSNVIVTVETPPTALPTPWLEADVGAVGIAGSSSFNGGTFTLNAGGTDIWLNSDAFHFVYQSWTGDGEIVVDCTGIANPSGAAWSMAAVMMRQDLTADSAHASMMITTDGKAKFRRRIAPGAATDSDGPTGGTTYPPRWLKLTRAGNAISAFISSTGASWTQIHTTQTVNMPATILVGFMALRNGSSAGTCAATFSNVSVSLPAPWQQADIGDTGPDGGASLTNGTFTVSGGGTDIWDTSDAFHYVFQPLSGDGEIVANLTALNNPAGASWSMAAVMVREKLTPDSIHASMMITTDGKAKFRRRTAEGATTSSDGPTGGTTYPPRWLKLTRVGNVFTASISTNGTSWTQIHTPQTVNMASNAYIGIMVLRSGATSATATGTFSNVTVTP